MLLFWANGKHLSLYKEPFGLDRCSGLLCLLGLWPAGYSSALYSPASRERDLAGEGEGDRSLFAFLTSQNCTMRNRHPFTLELSDRKYCAGILCVSQL